MDICSKVLTRKTKLKEACRGLLRMLGVHLLMTVASGKDTCRKNAGIQATGDEAKAQRRANKIETRQRMSPLGKGISEAADASRASQEAKLATKSAAELGQSARRSSPFWNKIGAASEGAGKLSLGVGVVLSAHNIATAPEGQRGEAVAGEIGAWGGAIAGGAGGAKLGAFIGTFIGGPGVGTAVGAAVGGLAGGVGGAIYGSEKGKAVYNWFKEDD